MKNILVTALFLGLTFAGFAQTPDEMAIQQVCEAETRSWLAADAATFNNCWQVRPYTRIFVTTEDGQTIAINGDQMKPAMKDAMGGGGSFKNSNYLFHIEGNSAWVTYDEVKTDDKGTHPSHEVRLLEKVNGAWKLVGMSVHHYKAN